MEQRKDSRSQADIAALIAIAFLAGCVVMGMIIFYMGLFPPPGQPVKAPTIATDNNPHITIPLSGGELKALYEDLVEYHSFINSLKVWWPILTFLAFSLAGGFAVYYVKTSIAEAKETIRDYVRKEIQQDLQDATHTSRVQLDTARTSFESFTKSLRALQAQADSSTQQSLGVLCWVSADALRLLQNSKAHASFLLEFAIIYSDRALKKLQELNHEDLAQIEKERINARICYIQANLAYYYALTIHNGGTKEKKELYSRSAIELVEKVMPMALKMTNEDEKFAQMDSCLYALSVCDRSHYCEDEFESYKVMFNRYRESLQAWFIRTKVKEISGREFSQLETFFNPVSKLNGN